ncbi:hypothetical protein [Actinophytocola glycyrrhizae]|uniref:Uncharacterized protein n=1 Tax=Actinophytocola glycyrrhizae TaxID=2044873 RepID=A0ABV9S087_9PSEU
MAMFASDGWSFTVPFDHGLLAIEDAETQSGHDDWDPTSQPTHLDGDSLYVNVCNSVDGPVTVTVVGQEHADVAGKNDMPILFSGKLLLPNRVLSVAESDNRAKLTLRTETAEAITVYGNDPDDPDQVMIVLPNCTLS